MANAHDIKHQIADALKAFASKPLYDAGLGLLDALGYRSELTLKLKGIRDFRETIDQHDRLNDKAAKVADWKNIEFLRQISGDELSDSGQAALPLQEKTAFQSGFIKSYVFLTIELKDNHYTRTDLAQITRAVNRVFDMPAMILFKHGEALTLSIINRRPHKREEIKDVLEKVTLIKDIQTAAPHRAHIEILFDLSVDELRRNHTVTNFDELHAAWRKALDSSELNKRFFLEVANWYFWALRNVEFPEDAERNKDVRNAISVIRMITRLIFIWFVKEKGLIPDELFNQTKLKSLLDYTDKNQSTYYKAILQNLFFATLNTEMNKDKPGSRKFRGKNKSDGRDQHYMIHNVFRYEGYFTSPQDTLKKYFENIPFLNGGLFECLDKIMASNGKDKVIRIDGFSDHPKNDLKVPDYLFFSSEQPVDLNEIYGTKNKNYKVRGLIDILDSYKFTVDENTPIEEEIALDPELLGKVFENLLASYNPETQTTARKQTGSFYTPREIVNYMVDESIIAHLTQALSKGEGSSNDKKSTPGWMTTEVGTYVGLKEFVKENRKNQTPTESLLWERLRNSQLGVKFRRQHPIGKYIADFVCLDNKLIIEIDGAIHNGQRENDEQRDKSLLEMGYRTVRFTKDEVIHNIDAVLKKIRDEVNAVSALPSPLERDGERLRHLVAYNYQPHEFTPAEVDVLIAAINTLKVLDPACGSGAFPMGMLHKLVYILGKLDPDNSKWRELQKQKAIKETEEAYKIGDKEEREKRLLDISQVFENNASDYGRKLYLIENCIFGVDIQPIAVQIAKLRFFVSLIVDQRIDPKKENLGVRPLPNLETKFVAANTLIGIEKPKVLKLSMNLTEIERKEEELKRARERHFTARTQQTKNKWRDEDKRLRSEISDLLKSDGWDNEVARKLAEWNPYDQNASADFFDPEWMFGIKSPLPLAGVGTSEGGFDIVLGNPPYINVSNLRPDAYRLYLRSKYRSAKNKTDTYAFFLEEGFNLLSPKGFLSYIIPQTWKATDSFSKLREIIFNEKSLVKVVDLEFGTFDAIVKPMVVLISNEKHKYKKIEIYKIYNEEIAKIDEITLREILQEPSLSINTNANQQQKAVFNKIESNSVKLENVLQFSRGIKTSDDNRFIGRQHKNSDYKKIFRGKNIKAYQLNWDGEYIWYRPDLMKEKVGSVSYSKDFFEVPEKIVIQRVNSSMQLLCAYDDGQNYFLDTTNVSRYKDWTKKTSLKYLCALLNSSVINYWYCNKYLMPTIGIYELHTIPIRISENQLPFIRLVDQILTTKKKDPSDDTSTLEKQIDEMVYALYNLTPEEIAIVEGNNEK